MQQIITTFLNGISTQLYIYQVITIILLLMYGAFFVVIVRKNSVSLLDLLIAYPISLVSYSLCGYFLLSFGIPFNKYTEIIAMLVFMAILYIGFCLRNNTKLSSINWKIIAVYMGVMVILALICTSGILHVSVTNDSMYYFSEYPRALVNYGKINAQLDSFLTDASQGISILGTIPFLYGYDEIFGIQALLNINFIVIFAYAVFDLAKRELKEKADNKYCVLVGVIAAVILVTSMPFVIMSKWLIANSFFMEYMVIVVYLAFKYSDGMLNQPGTNQYVHNTSDLAILSILITGLSIMRMEGALNAGVLILCILMLGYRGRDIVTKFICPILVLQGMYLFRIFGIITLHTDVQFMTKGKALVLIAFLVAIAIYALLIRDRISDRVVALYPYALIGGLVAVNIVICLYDTGDYLNNMKAFIFNVLRNSGWGLFASFVIGVLILIPKKSLKINYFDITVLCYLLLTIVVGWARGDSFYEGFGDSGNRILIQVVPIMLLALAVKVIDGISYWKNESKAD